jgi:DUF1016 N-terminal domain
MASKKKSAPTAHVEFESLMVSIVQIYKQGQEFAAKAVNVGLTVRNWFIGYRIVEFGQQGRDRAAYGKRLLPELAKRLAAAGLRWVDSRELRRFRLLYTVYCGGVDQRCEEERDHRLDAQRKRAGKDQGHGQTHFEQIWLPA